MAFLLDTNAWLWLFSEPERIRSAVRDTLRDEGTVYLSPMSIIEVAQKAAKGRLELLPTVEQWVRDSIPDGRIKLLPISVEIALRAYEWPDDFHGDPADRIIAATSVVHGLTLVTSDEKLHTRSDVQTLSTR